MGKKKEKGKKVAKHFFPPETNATTAFLYSHSITLKPYSPGLRKGNPLTWLGIKRNQIYSPLVIGFPLPQKFTSLVGVE